MRGYQREISYRPWCRNAERSWNVARFALAVFILTALMLRYEFIGIESGFAVFTSAFILAALALLLALFAFVRIWRTDDRGIVSALLGFLCAAMILVMPLFLQGYLFLHPVSADISTDVAEPPPFSRSSQAFSLRAGNVPEMPEGMAVMRQAETGAEIGSLTVETDAATLFQQVQEIARDQGWPLVATVPPGGRIGDGHVDLTARTAILRLPVDVTIRIRPAADGARVDIRCISRYPRSDISDNATIVRKVMEVLAKGPPLG